MKYAIIGALLVLSGCASTPEATNEKFDASMNSWVGSTDAALISNFGIPLKQFEVDKNTKMYEYELGSGATLVSGYGNMGVATTASCRVTFTSESGKVTHYKWVGNSCRSN